MNDWETDKKIAEWIRGVMEEREEKYIPGSWENFVRSRKKKQRIVFMRFISGAAAGLLGIWLIFQFFVPEMEQDLVETNYKTPEESEHLNESTEKGITSVQTPSLSGQTTRNIEPTQSDKSGETKTESASETRVDHVGKFPEIAFDETTILLDSVQSEIYEEPDFSDTLFLADEKNRLDSEKHTAVLTNDTDIVQTNPKKQRTGHKVRFGIYFSPGFNSMSGNSALAFSGGISADFRLSRALFVSTGIQAEQQNLLRQEPNYEFMGIDNQTTANLLCLDIPLNLTWKFSKQQSTSYYVSGGISSLAYLDEDYKNKTTTQELIEVVKEVNGQETVEYEVVTKETETWKSVPPLQTFNFAGRLNLMVGMEQKITPKLHIHIEPYVKIPLSGLGAQNLRFTTSGLQCKLSF
ncbi:outer membrane beta-barrel protein [Maribellus maritimus]|uniref:outer membrane beta-barrel protein n=1 Tax=Maribellus maritimus TaxID=2870838 RepID=UPI001EEBF4E3|nr:outer membrane beta-barrel protein [Maribellus maritimus]MCG6191190.1 PorT family protein [Maribellus maritimus]